MNNKINNQFEQLLREAVALGASDVHLASNEPVHLRIDGELCKPAVSCFSAERVEPEIADRFANWLLSAHQKEMLESRGAVDGAFSLDEENRFRFNIYRRDGNLCLALRFLSNHIPGLEELGLNETLYNVCDVKDGLVLVAGPTGSGKSTTIASLIDRINNTRSCHIITIEDPVEYVHRSKQALVNQRSIGTDVMDFNSALVDAMRQDPDVILVGELRDIDTIRTAITAAETGHLVFGSVHAGDCKTSIERLVGAFSAEEQQLAQRLVATVIRTVIVQHLLPRTKNPNLAPNDDEPKRVLASEVLHGNSAVSNLIANGKLSQLNAILETCGDEGMWTLDDSLAKLWRSRKISEQTARSLSRNPEVLLQLVRRSYT